MSDDYITNVIAFLTKDVEYFLHATMRRNLLQMHGDLLLGRISAEVVAHAVGAPALTDLTPTGSRRHR